jgi:hypothetical protein
MKPAKRFLFPQINLMILRTQVPQLIHDLVIHSVLLILGRLAPFPGGLPPLFSLPTWRYAKPLLHDGFSEPLQTTRTHFTTLVLFNADP